ncbi:hypothetical protein [Nocardioides solisilvae]|uniref:hypothetical protein n=1 Tax=Nocardioides solisilvae TaxID=1542435 RepID=UPI000D74D1A0|nr:hypothetical protein [Nocardioides solisilvae]
MSAALADTSPRPQGAAVRGRRLRWVACFLLACWVVTLVWLSLVSVRPATLADLEADLRDGEVGTLEATGGLDHPGANGYALVDLRWRSGWGLREARALEATPGRTTAEARREQRSWTGGPTPVVEPGLRERLVALDPDVRLVETDLRGGHGTLFAWKTPLWSFWLLLALTLATFAVLRLQPSPHRATRAAWGWLVVLTVPVGSIAYLVLGGPAGLLAAPRPGRRRLTGGWAFLLACAVVAVLTPEA